MNCEPNGWVIAGQLATPLFVALVGGYFAWQQTVTAKKKLRLDLFDKRFVIFNAARTFLGRAIVFGKPSIDDENAFVIGRTGASFLLNDELAEYLEEVHKRAMGAVWAHNEIESAPSDDERKKAGAKWLAERAWLDEQLKLLGARFAPFLQLEG